MLLAIIMKKKNHLFEICYIRFSRLCLCGAQEAVDKKKKENSLLKKRNTTFSALLLNVTYLK